MFDSDVMSKKEVAAALVRLKAFLEHKGAKVKVIYLPDAENGSKQGVDDYLVSGHSVDELKALATSELKSFTVPRPEIQINNRFLRDILRRRHRRTRGEQRPAHLLLEGHRPGTPRC